MMAQTSVLIPIDRPEIKDLSVDAERGSGRIICQGKHIQTIDDIKAIEQDWSVIYANKYDRFEFHRFGGWRKESTPVSYEAILLSCRCQF